MDDRQLEDRLRGALSAADRVDPPVSLLPSARERAARRSRRRAVVGGAAAVIVMFGFASLVLASRSRDADTEVQTTPLFPNVPESGAGATARPLDGDAPPVAATLLAILPNEGVYSVIDLAARTITTYEPGEHRLPRHAAPSGATITSRGDVVVCIETDVYVFDGTDLTREPRKLPMHEPHLEPGLAPELHVAATPDGEGLWLVQTGSGARPTRIELVDIETGALRFEFEMTAPAVPVGATAERLVLDEVSTERVWTLRRNRTSLLVRAEGRSAGLDATSGFVAVVEPGRLLLVDTASVDQRTLAGAWEAVGGPAIPSTSAPLPVATEGAFLVRRVAVEDGEGSEPAGVLELVTVPAPSPSPNVDAVRATSRRVVQQPRAQADEERNPFSMAFWSRDGGVLALRGQRDVYLVRHTVRDPDAEVIVPLVELPEGQFLFAAG